MILTVIQFVKEAQLRSPAPNSSRWSGFNRPRILEHPTVTHFFILAICVLSTGCAQFSTNEPEKEQLVLDPLKDFTLPAPGYLAEAPLSLWASHYFSWDAKRDEDGIALLGAENQSITEALAKSDWCQAVKQGRVSLRTQGNWITFEAVDTRGPRQLDCTELKDSKSTTHHPSFVGINPRTRFKQVDGAFGKGVRGFLLVPFRTLAVDANRIRYGSLLFIPDLVGAEIQLPDGRLRTHDGYFFAADSEREIRGSQVRIFQGTQAENAFPEQVQSRSDRRIKAWVINNPELANQLERAHRGESIVGGDSSVETEKVQKPSSPD